MKRNSLAVCFMWALFFSLVVSNQAHASVVSTFASDLDGWSAYNNTCIVAWQSDGTMRSGDNGSSWAWVTAPAKFHGQWKGDGIVSVDLNFTGTVTPLLYPTAFSVESATTSYQYIFKSPPPVNSWQTFSVSMSDPGWTRTLGSGSLASVLNDVKNFYIRVDFNDSTTTTTDAVKLDNIAAPVVPVPPAIWLLGTGLAGLIAMRRKLPK